MANERSDSHPRQPFLSAAPQREDWVFLNPLAGGTLQHWRALENLNRVLILAEPGAGKTFEARHQSRKLSEKGGKALGSSSPMTNASTGSPIARR